MQRPKRAAASKPISYADAAPSSDDDGQAQRSTRRPAKKPRLSTTATKGKGEGTDAATTTANLLTASELHARGVVKQMDSCARECSLSFYHERNRTTYFRLEDVQSTNDRLKQLRAKLTVAQRLAESSRPYTNSRRNPVEQAKVDETLKKAAQAVVAAEQPLGTFIRERRVLAEAARRVSSAYLPPPSLSYSEPQPDFWTRISPTLIEAVEEHKVERVARALAYVRLGAMRAQHELVRRRHKALFQAQQGEAFVTWPAFEVFQLLPTVERHWIGDVVSKTEADWTSDLPAILAEVDAARRAIKIGFARDVMNKLRATGVYVDEGLAVKLEHPRQRVTPIGASMRSTPIPDCRHLERLFQAGRDISVDLGDIASDVDDSELDRLFSHPSAVLKIKDRRKEFATPFRYPQIHAELRDRGAIGTASCASFLSAADLALSRFQVDVLAHVGLAGLAPTDPTLLTRGPIFPCLRCIADGRKPSMMAKLRGWAGTMDHYDAVHA
ncbi:uncharacterized protein RHOBADRAFT_21569 [Rhodotorula graminis WP1]|uniref:Uncharacterized protein n=1 Tax=Rhodotorula graminis (strain WP1) TaxID=578459 RepID=A0A194S968_RHOGW|nr:uncharacterized protein RHOBADRAFT_21569 [Rhodotorula graminis WP1]KPV77142.1 hypothetical protein RHOBADRAFT_21569 [Rhodotorula graminis WP1]